MSLLALFFQDDQLSLLVEVQNLHSSSYNSSILYGLPGDELCLL